MANEEIYDYIAEEVEDIKEGLRKRHRTGAAGFASTEMVNLRDKTDELSMALADDNEEKRRKKLKEAYKASLNYEMYKREDTVDYDWSPKTEMGKERMKSSRRLRNLVTEYFPELAQQALSEFREETKNHKYSAAAAAVSDYAQGDINNVRRKNIDEQRQILNRQRKSIEEAELDTDNRPRKSILKNGESMV